MSSRPVLNSSARVFIAQDGLGCGGGFSYHSCMKVTGLQKDIGSVEFHYCASDVPGEFEEVALVRGAPGRWTATLTGPKPRGSKSVQWSLLKSPDCSFGVQVHFGACSDPLSMTDFDSVFVIEGAYVSDYSSDDLVSLQPSERAVVNETVTFTAKNVHEVYSDFVIEDRAGAFVGSTGFSVRAVAGSTYQDCEGCAKACDRFYAFNVPYAGAGSCLNVGLLYTLDGGETWAQQVLSTICVPTMGTENYNMVSTGGRLFISYPNQAGLGEIMIIDEDSIGTGSLSFFTLQPGFIPYALRVIEDSLILAGSGGRISRLDLANLTVTTVESGTNFLSDFYAVDGLDADNYIAGGGAGQLAVTTNGTTFKAVTGLTETISSVLMVTKKRWLVGTIAGNLYCTGDYGTTWTLVRSLGGCVTQISMSTEGIGYAVTGYPAVVWRTLDAGGVWAKVADDAGKIPAQAVFTGVAACPFDPAKFVAAGFYGTSAPVSPCAATGSVPDQGDFGLVVVGRNVGRL